MRHLFLILLMSTSALGALDKKTALFNSLEPTSLEELFAYYQLYSDEPLGQEALLKAGRFLQASQVEELKQIASCFNPNSKLPLSEGQIRIIQKLAQRLPNRRLKGFNVTSKEEVCALQDDEVDLGKALILSQHKDPQEARTLAEEYTAKLDLMAFHILARLPENATFMDKIVATNHYVFETMHFRFPPQSLFAKEIDTYTFLPSVMDDHLGVCLGVTALYLSLAQRLDLPLEIITPPGHIFLRYRDADHLINIETTARGIHVPSEHYLGMNTHTLPMRTVKEVVAMTHINQASVFLQKERFSEAVEAYKQALAYDPDDLLTCELLGYALLLDGKIEEGKKYLERIYDRTPEHAVVKHSLAEDYLKGNVNEKGILIVFQEVNAKRSSILQKIERMSEVLETYPNFRDGLMQMAVCYLQLGRLKEALPFLERYYAIDQSDPTVAYYLAVLYAEHHDLNRSWQLLNHAKEITQQKQFYPRALKELQIALREIALPS